MNKRVFLILLLLGVIAWVASIPILYLFFPHVKTANDFGEMFGAVNALFSALALGGVIYTVIVQIEDSNTNRNHLEKSIRAAEHSAKISAYSALLQSCEFSLERYERWEKSESRGDYTKVKQKVREHVNRYREELEKLTQEMNN